MNSCWSQLSAPALGAAQSPRAAQIRVRLRAVAQLLAAGRWETVERQIAVGRALQVQVVARPTLAAPMVRGERRVAEARRLTPASYLAMFTQMTVAHVWRHTARFGVYRANIRGNSTRSGSGAPRAARAARPRRSGSARTASPTGPRKTRLVATAHARSR